MSFQQAELLGTVADPKLIFVGALKANACSIIISHNHPSGNLKPSQADEQLTQKIKQEEIKEFGVYNEDHQQLIRWILDSEVQTVAMESTGFSNNQHLLKQINLKISFR